MGELAKMFFRIYIFLLAGIKAITMFLTLGGLIT